MRVSKSGLVAAVFVMGILNLNAAPQAFAAQTTIMQPTVGQPGAPMNYQPYVPQQQQTSQNMYNNTYNAMQNATLAQPNPQNPNQPQQVTQIKYIYKGGVNDSHPIAQGELPQRIFHNCPCKNYTETW